MKQLTHLRAAKNSALYLVHFSLQSKAEVPHDGTGRLPPTDKAESIPLVKRLVFEETPSYACATARESRSRGRLSEIFNNCGLMEVVLTVHEFWWGHHRDEWTPRSRPNGVSYSDTMGRWTRPASRFVGQRPAIANFPLHLVNSTSAMSIQSPSGETHGMGENCRDNRVPSQRGRR